MVISSHSLTLPVSGTLRPCYTDSFLGCSLQNVAMEAAREGEFDLFSLVISFSVPRCESIPGKQKTVRYRWSIMNTEILEKKSKSLYWRNVNTHSQNAFWQERKQRQISEKKRDTLPFWTLSCKILIKCTSVELRLFFYFKENGILRVKSVLKYVTFNPIQCSSFLRRGMITRTGTSDELSRFIEDSNRRTSPKYLSLKSFSMPRERSRFG